MEGGQPDQEGGFPRVRLTPYMLIFNVFSNAGNSAVPFVVTGPSSLSSCKRLIFKIIERKKKKGRPVPTLQQKVLKLCKKSLWHLSSWCFLQVMHQFPVCIRDQSEEHRNEQCMVKAVQAFESADEELIHIFSLPSWPFLLVAYLTRGTSAIGSLKCAGTTGILLRR